MNEEKTFVDTLALHVGKIVLMLALVYFVGWLLSTLKPDEEYLEGEC